MTKKMLTSAMISNFFVLIPFLPPGINAQYIRHRYTGQIILSTKAREWKKNAAMVIGARAGVLGWEVGEGQYDIEILVGGSRSDADAYVKTIVDTVTQKLGFDDRRVRKVTAEKVKGKKLWARYVLEETTRTDTSLGSELDDVYSGIYVGVTQVEG
ncbi:hypothetical protein IMZ48_42400 [Candidatus Bathyarchaeota archaeon]|nr:hypothetical protein [Candidatus Bathyarchaeota archaeon]